MVVRLVHFAPGGGAFWQGAGGGRGKTRSRWGKNDENRLFQTHS